MCLPVMIRSRGLRAALQAACSGTALPLRDRTNLSKRDQHFAPSAPVFSWVHQTYLHQLRHSPGSPLC